MKKDSIIKPLRFFLSENDSITQSPVIFSVNQCP